MSEESIWIQKKKSYITKKEYDSSENTNLNTEPNEWIKKKEKPTEWIKKKEKPIQWIKKKTPVNMATGGLMSMPPFIAKQEDDKDKGISPYDINTPAEARQGLPSRLLAKSRTRFNKGGFPDLDGSGDTTMKDILIGRGVIKKAKGGIMSRQKYNKGDEAIRLLRDIDIPEELEEAPAEGDIPGEKYAGGKAAKDKMIIDKIERLEAAKEMQTDSSMIAKINNEIKSLESKVSTRITAADGGYMDENKIAEETPLALNIGGAVRRPEERKDYQAYAEGDMVEDESLLSPMGMEEEDAIAETDMEMTAEDEMEDDMDYDSILDTSALSEEEETVLDEAVEMHPELESIIPKIVATEFTEDELVEGPGDGTSDSIPAMLSDGEFVFTAKAVKNIGVDKLRKMMKQAEESYDAGQISQEEDAAMAAEDSLLA